MSVVKEPGTQAKPSSSNADSPIHQRTLAVLYLTFYFPPLGGGGVQRALKFVKYLPEYGFEPVVVTGPGEQRTRHAPLDASLTSECPSGLRIFRVAQTLPQDSRPDQFWRRLGYPSLFARAWVSSCQVAALRAASSRKIDVILASMSPFETSEAADLLSQKLGVPWVADLRDPWALDEMLIFPTRWHRARELRRMHRRLSSSSLVIMNTPEAASALSLAFPDLSERTLAITNGFDANDFLGDPLPRDDDRFRIVHTGSLHVGLGSAHRRRRRLRRWIGGERVPVDILARSHIYLLRALELWRRNHPGEVDRTELILAGDLSAADRAAVAESAVVELVRMPGYLSHSESVALLRSADLLFLPLHNLPPGDRARIVPGKTYEYLAAKRPILAAVPEGDARDFVLASGLGHVCEPNDPVAMAAILHRRFEAKRAGQVPVPASASFYRQFERRKLTEDLARALDSVVRSTHVSPGAE